MSKGLEDVVATTSAITFIDGARGRLLYCGYDINDLARYSTYEEVAYLLWHQRLPREDELATFSKDLASKRVIPRGVLSSLDSLSYDCDTMDALEMAIAALGIYDDPSLTEIEKAASIASKIGTVVPYIHRHKYKLRRMESRTDLSFAAELLYLLTGDEPDKASEKLMNVILVTHADHELNASTFTARVVASTLSDMYSSITAAVAALKGSLHGGANERVVEMVQQIGSPENVPAFLREKLANKEKIMGFGHRVYKTLDPRAKILRDYASQIAIGPDEKNNLAILDALADEVLKQKGIYPNVDFYSGFVLHHLGVPTYLFTSVFAVGRTPGWLAHVMEQYSNNRIIRPIAEYTGTRDEVYVPIELREGKKVAVG
jgi:citrate synthase